MRTVRAGSPFIVYECTKINTNLKKYYIKSLISVRLPLYTRSR